MLYLYLINNHIFFQLQSLSFIAGQYLFNFKQKLFHSAKVIIQLLPKLCLFNNNNYNYSSSTVYSYLITYLLS